MEAGAAAVGFVQGAAWGDIRAQPKVQEEGEGQGVGAAAAAAAVESVQGEAWEEGHRVVAAGAVPYVVGIWVRKEAGQRVGP